MIMTECKTCEGFGWGECTNEECQNGRVALGEEEKVYVNVYSVTRHFGGHEEGGWYYDWYMCVETIPCKNKYSDEIAKDLEEAYAKHKRGDISSVLGGVDVVVYVEDEISKSATRERPMYE